MADEEHPSALPPFELDAEAGPPLHEQLSQHLSDYLVSGRVSVGAMLPSEHAICRQFDVSRVTVRRAIDRLVKLGMIERQPGRGMFVARTRPRPVGHDTRLISLIVTNTLGAFMSMLTEGVEQVARQRGYRVTVSVSGDDFEREQRGIDDAVRQGVAGMLLMPTVAQDGVNPNCYDYLRVQHSGVPLLLVDRYLPSLPLGYVVGANRQSMRGLTEQVISHGHKHIGYLDAPIPVTSLQDRYQGFLEAMLAHRLIPEPLIQAEPRRPGTDDMQMGERAVRQFLEQGGELPTALLACNSYLAIGAQRALRAAGVHVPDDVALVGFEDVPEASVLEVPLTVVDVPVSRLGQVAAERLIDVIENDSDPSQVREELPAELISRVSCGGVAGADDPQTLA